MKNTESSALLIVVDDFYKNVDDVRKFALSQKFLVEGNYPGFRTVSLLNESTKDNIERLLLPHGGKVIDWLETDKETYSGAFQISYACHKSWMHTDKRLPQRSQARQPHLGPKSIMRLSSHKV